MAEAQRSTNVIRLPTAATRKVVQVGGLAMHSLSKALPQHPAAWEDHGGRKAWQEGRFDQSAEMMIAAAVFQVLLPDQKEIVRKLIGTMADLNMSPHAAGALHVVEKIK